MTREMTILKSEAEHEQALDEVEKFFETEPRPGTPEARRFDELAQAIAAYEREHWAISDKSTAEVGSTDGPHPEVPAPTLPSPACGGGIKGGGASKDGQAR